MPSNRDFRINRHMPRIPPLNLLISLTGSSFPFSFSLRFLEITLNHNFFLMGEEMIIFKV